PRNPRPCPHLATPEERSHARHTTARQRCARPGSETAESGEPRSTVLNLQRVVFRCVFWAHSSPSCPAEDLLWWPKSLTDRPRSSTELGDVSSVRREMCPVACWPRVRHTCGQSRSARAAGHRWHLGGGACPPGPRTPNTTSG